MQSFTRSLPYIYLLLALVGGGMTFYYILLGIIEHQGHFDSIEFIQSTWTENAYARSLTLDFWTGAVAGTLFILLEGIRLKIKFFWLYIVITIIIGFATGFPLFLFVRAMKMRRTDA